VRKHGSGKPTILAIVSAFTPAGEDHGPQAGFKFRTACPEQNETRPEIVEHKPGSAGVGEAEKVRKGGGEGSFRTPVKRNKKLLNGLFRTR